MGCIKSKEKKKENTDLPPIGANDAAPKAVDPRLPFETYRQLFQMKNSWKAISRALEPTAKSNLIRYMIFIVKRILLVTPGDQASLLFENMVARFSRSRNQCVSINTIAISER